MGRSKPKKQPPSTTTTTPTRTTPKKQNANEDCKEEEEEEALLSVVTTSITETLRFLSSSDLQLPASSAVALSSLLSLSSSSLASLLSLLSLSVPLPLPLPPPPRSPTPPFSWFRRFLSSSTSPSDPRWLDNFRMSKPSFYLLLSSLSPSLLSLHSFSPSPVPPDLKLASALFRLAHAAPFPFLARRFGLSDPSLAARAFYEVLRALSLSLSHLFELATDAPRILQGFTWMSLPNCCGALGYCRFHADGVFGSVIAQCLVDSEGRFLDVSVGWHGSMRPADILAKTKLFGARSAILDDGRYFIGGACCPLLPWLLTPYNNSNSSSNNNNGNEFNTVHARGMELVERAFRRLKGRWKLLRMEWKEECVEALPYVVIACCLLHNYLIKCSEPVVEDGEGDCGNEEDVGFKEFEGKGDDYEGGERIRDAIASQLSQVFHK